MELLATTIFNLCVLFVLWRLSKRKPKEVSATYRYNLWRDIDRHYRQLVQKLIGRVEKAERKSAIAEKTADRAFNMASSANLGVVALQKALAVPRIMTKQQAVSNKLAKDGVDQLFTANGSMEWLKPILGPEELELIEKAEEEALKESLKK